MSAPRTNIETQKRWHRGPLIGMFAVVVFALGLLFWQMVIVADEGTPEEGGVPENGDPAAVPAPGNDTPPGDLPATPANDIPPGDLPATPGNDLPPAEIPTPAPDVEIPPAPANAP